MMMGDGLHDGRSYSTTSKRLADDVQEILLKMGRVGNIVRIDNNNPNLSNTKPLYTVHIPRTEYNPLCASAPSHRGFTNYKGMVYCVKVPNELIYVRRNGKPLFCGNTYSFQWDPKYGFTKPENDPVIRLFFLPFMRATIGLLNGMTNREAHDLEYSEYMTNAERTSDPEIRDLLIREANIFEVFGDPNARL